MLTALARFAAPGFVMPIIPDGLNSSRRKLVAAFREGKLPTETNRSLHLECGVIAENVGEMIPKGVEVGARAKG